MGRNSAPLIYVPAMVCFGKVLKGTLGTDRAESYVRREFVATPNQMRAFEV